MAPGLKYGLLAAAGMSAWMLAEYAAGLHSTRIGLGQYTSWGTEAILVATLWRQLHQRLHAPGRRWLPVWEGLQHGTIASLVAAMGLYIFISVYVNFINPDYPDVYLDWSVAQMRAAGKSEEEIRTVARDFRSTMSPRGLPVKVFGLCLLMGVIASPLLTLWLNWRWKEPVHTG